MTGSIGKYRIDGVLGKGAMGIVYKAFDPQTNRAVALKTLHKTGTSIAHQANLAERLKTEAQAGRLLRHPNIVNVFDYGEIQKVSYIAMEIVEGTSLTTLLAPNKPIATASVMTWMSDLLRALGYAHEHGVVHRDIKPANLLITRSNHLKISDFGVACIHVSAMSKNGMMAGTPSYMSPEQFRGEAIDGRSDLFSAGIVLYQLLTGHRPFTGTTHEVMRQIRNMSPRLPSQILPSLGRGFDAVVAKALAKSVDERYGSAREFLHALQSAHRFVGCAALSSSNHTSRDTDPSQTSACLVSEPHPKNWASSENSIGRDVTTSWKQIAILRLEVLLCRQIGPAGKFLVQKAAATASDVDALAAVLLELISSPRGRVQFQQSLTELKHHLAKSDNPMESTPSQAPGASCAESANQPETTKDLLNHH